MQDHATVRSEGPLIAPSEQNGDDPRRLRIRGHNELLALAARSHRFEDDVPVPFLCECDEDECQECVPLTLPEFLEWRETLTFTASGHAVAGAIAVSHTDAYTLHLSGPSQQ